MSKNALSSSCLRKSIYTISALVALASVEPAQSDIQVTNYNRTLNLGNGFSFDVNGDSTLDFTVFNNSTLSLATFSGNVNNTVAIDGFNNLDLMTSGEPISLSNTFAASDTATMPGDGTTFYTGMKLMSGLDAHLAWLSLTRSGSRLIVNSAGYNNTPNQGIEAGSIVPEPSTGWLVAVTAAIGTLCFWRRRAKDADAGI
ncbi:MAG: PEP-CTERM sorting domain-containing protein [Verrucomicrobiota bacterium]